MPRRHRRSQPSVGGDVAEPSVFGLDQAMLGVLGHLVDAADLTSPAWARLDLIFIDGSGETSLLPKHVRPIHAGLWFTIAWSPRSAVVGRIA